MSTVPAVPAVRIHAAVPSPARRAGRYVLYWMTAARRASYNHALQRALAWCEELGRPLVVLEALRVDYPYACERFHRFVVDGMADNAARFGGAGVTYLPLVERAAGEGRGLLDALAADACVVVGDDYPTFFLPRMRARAAERLAEAGVRFEVVDSNGLLPLRSSSSAFGYAHQFRRFVQKTLPAHLDGRPLADPLGLGPGRGAGSVLPDGLASRFRFATTDELARPEGWLAELPIDHRVGAVEERGGASAGATRLQAFVRRKLSRYHEDRSHPDDEVASGLSPWLHFGHVSSFEILDAVAERTGWSPDRIAPKPTGKREGWWNASEAGDAFLDELVTWRELGFARCQHTDDYARYEGLPAWARQTLEEHAADPRPAIRTVEALERGETEDEVWNAAMRELRETGRIQNYVRMLWGKKTLEWTRHPREAFEALIHLNDKYAIDGRDPNTYTNVGWVLGAYDRPWGPERKLFGKVRYMTSAATVRKLRIEGWLARWGDGRGRTLGLGLD